MCAVWLRVIDEVDDTTLWPTFDELRIKTEELAWRSWTTEQLLLMVTVPCEYTLPWNSALLLHVQLPFVYMSASLPVYPFTLKLFPTDKLESAKIAFVSPLKVGRRRTSVCMVRAAEGATPALPVEVSVAAPGSPWRLIGHVIGEPAIG